MSLTLERHFEHTQKYISSFFRKKVDFVSVDR